MTSWPLWLRSVKLAVKLISTLFLNSSIFILNLAWHLIFLQLAHSKITLVWSTAQLSMHLSSSFKKKPRTTGTPRALTDSVLLLLPEMKLVLFLIRATQLLTCFTVRVSVSEYTLEQGSCTSMFVWKAWVNNNEIKGATTMALSLLGNSAVCTRFPQ